MDRFVEIVNSARVRSNTNLVVDGIRVCQSEWNNYGFYPNKGVVGVVIGEAQCYEGTIYLVQCDDRIIVPILPSGIRDITIMIFASAYLKILLLVKQQRSK